MWSQDFVSDEVRRAAHLQYITLIGFIEAIARLVCFVQLPTLAEMEEYSCSSIEEIYAKVEGGELQVEVLRGGVDKAPDWRVEDGSSASIGESLDTLLRFIVCRMDRDGDRDIDEAELMRTRKERQERRKKQAEAQMRAKLDFEMHKHA
uniref:EF-hand domain-containing protein n=1 Tax=Prymnesium polylepis TaxID=72548 RepID=A0A7S4M2X9_9EUKA